MKVFKTAKGAFNYIKRNLNTGIEKTVNDSVHFGVGDSVYAYSKDMQYAGYVSSTNTFTHILSDHVLLDVINSSMSYNNNVAIIQ